MGFPTQEHIQQFVRGKTIDRMESRCEGAVLILHFTNGESLKLVTVAQMPQRPGIETVATPFGVDGVVKQSVQIMEAAEAREKSDD